MDLVANIQDQHKDNIIQPYPNYLYSNWYRSIVYFEKNLNCPDCMEK